MELRHAIILTALLFLRCTLCAQPSWRIDKLGVSDGLSQGYVYVIHQDKKGFIWIGTHGGLNRYDGYSFRVFQYSPFNSSTLGDNAVFFLKEDSTTGHFWMGGSSCLNEFDPQTFVNTRYYYNKKQLEFADGIFMNRHEMLLACEYAVLLFDTHKKLFLEIPVFDENDNPVSISRIENTASDSKGNFMVMSRTGIFFYDPLTKSCRRKTKDSPDFSAFNQSEVFNVIQDSRGYYWIATSKKGLIRFDALTKASQIIALPPPLKNESLRFEVVMEDSHGNIWAGSSKGLFKIDRDALTTEYFSSDNKDDVFLSHGEINAINEDRNHFIWVGTVGGGINKMIPSSTGFKNLALTKNISDGNTGTYIMAMQQMGNDIWFTNIWDQAGKTNLQTGKTTLLTKQQLQAHYSWYSEGTLIKNSENEIVALNGEYQYYIKENPGNKILVRAEAAPGLTHIHHAFNGKKLYMVKAPVEETFQRNDTIYGNCFFYDAVDDASGNVWIGSSKGLVKFNTLQNQLVHYQHDEGNTNSVSSDYIYSLEIDDTNETIWMAAYNGGLCSYQMRSETFQHYSKEDGLADNIVYSIEKDHHGNFWFSSNAGISAYDARTKTFRNYGVADGLLNNEFNRRSSLKNKEGWLFFGGASGIDYFHPDSIVKSNSTPILAFTNFKILNKDYLPGQKDAMPVIELKPVERQITIEFASLNYYDQKKIQYAYRLNSDEWITMGNRHMLSFSDLATGDHRLYIRSTNSEGMWLSNEIACLITVRPWWWQTWWFRIGSVFLAIGLFIAVTRSYYQRKLEKQKVILERRQAVEKERTRIATDMHDDLGANLSRIKFLSETMGIKKQKQETIEGEINSIRHYSHEMIDKMGEIVWALNEKNDSLSDLLSYTRSYAVEYLSQNGLQSIVETPSQAPTTFVSGEFRRNVYLTVKEALHNIVKHSGASKVDIRVETGKQLFISIHDNGKGFDETNIRPFSNGIPNMKKRIATLGGNLEIKNTDGTTIILVVPLP